MKRGEPPKRKTPLKRGGKIKSVSVKRARENRVRAKIKSQVLRTRSVCEAGQAINAVDRHHQCHRSPDDIHEPLTRARGGSITDPDNMIVVCRACHNWIHQHPKAATTVGLLIHSYTDHYDVVSENLDDRGQGKTMDSQRRENVASSQASTTNQRDSTALVLPDETVSNTKTESDNSVSDSTGQGQAVAT